MTTTVDLPSRGTVAADDNSHLDSTDLAQLLEARIARKRILRDHPEVGEWVRFACGTMRRISHVWEWGEGPESIQTSDGGSFHLSSSGHVDMSGGLHPGMKPHTFKPTDETRPGWVWIWHHGRPAAHNGVDARIPFRVWENTEPAN